jgi:hypothetical protein
LTCARAADDPAIHAMPSSAAAIPAFFMLSLS